MAIDTLIAYVGVYDSVEAAVADYQVVKDLPYDQWLRVVLEVVPTAPTGTMRLRYDGLLVYENLSVPFSAAASVPQTYVDLGLARFSAPSPAFDVLYDNVTIEQIP